MNDAAELLEDARTHAASDLMRTDGADLLEWAVQDAKAPLGELMHALIHSASKDLPEAVRAQLHAVRVAMIDGLAREEIRFLEARERELT